jgi:predicted DCC family thiol-disulfide oxidoreductase YuxK
LAWDFLRFDWLSYALSPNPTTAIGIPSWDNGHVPMTFVYDGDCGFCTRCAMFARRRVPTPAAIVAWQQFELGPLGLTEAECDQAVQWVEPGRAPLAGPDAIAALLRTSHRAWRVVGRLLQLAAVRALAWPTYRWVARNRHRMPGGTAACALPGAPEPTA